MRHELGESQEVHPRTNGSVVRWPFEGRVTDEDGIGFDELDIRADEPTRLLSLIDTSDQD